MKNLSLILNAVLAAAVIALYVLFFTSDKKPNSGSAAMLSDTGDVAISHEGIVYIDIDSVLANFDMYFDLQTDFQEKIKTSEAQLASKQKSLQKEAGDFQYKVERGLVTRAEAEQLQQDLMAKEQGLYQLQQSLQMQLAEEEQVAYRKVLNTIIEYLDKIQEDGELNYQYVLGNTFGGNILYADRSKNITKSVIAGLNEEYQASQEED